MTTQIIFRFKIDKPSIVLIEKLHLSVYVH